MLPMQPRGLLSGMRRAICCLCRMGDVMKRLQQLDKEFAALAAKVEDAYEKYESAADDAAKAKAAWQVAGSTVDAQEEAKLKGCYDELTTKVERRKQHYEDLKEKEKQLNSRRAKLEAKLFGSGERSPPPACIPWCQCLHLQLLPMVRVKHQGMVHLGVDDMSWPEQHGQCCFLAGFAWLPPCASVLVVPIVP